MKTPKITGAELIQRERIRQIEEEGFTPEHDTQHFEGKLAYAAICYAYPNKRLIRKKHDGDGPDLPAVHLKDGPEGEGTYLVMPPSVWPFELKSWKPTPDDRIRELTKAGAMIAAEIDRLQAKREKLLHDNGLTDSEQ